MAAKLSLTNGLTVALTAFAVAILATVASRADMTASRAELPYVAADPELYALARQYFPGDEDGVPAKRLFRLTRDQIDMTVASLFPTLRVASVRTAMARDPLQTNYEYAEVLSVNGANAGALSSWIAAIADQVRKEPKSLSDCAAADIACLKRAARTFALKAFRGDVAEDRLKAIEAFYLDGVAKAGLPQASGDLVEVVLNSPRFLFRSEVETSAQGRLSPAQLLQSVSYTIADAPPDALSLEAGRAGEYLRDGKEAAATIRALSRSAAAREKLVRFFKAWLEIREPADFTISTEVFPEFKPGLAAAIVGDTDRFLRAKLMADAPSLKDITQSADAFASRETQSIVGAKSAATDKPISLDPSQRLGIFSQPAVLASHSGPTNSRTIKRGVFFTRKVMCMEMGQPSKEVLKAVEESYPALQTTERARIESATGEKGCAGCHKVIDPFGFALENYDAIGRWRTRDNGHPIDASILIDYLDEDAVKTTGPVEALKAFTSSAMFKQCFVRQLFRYYMGRQEEPSDDPLLRRMFLEFALGDRQDILQMVYMLTSSDRIVRRQ